MLKIVKKISNRINYAYISCLDISRKILDRYNHSMNTSLEWISKEHSEIELSFSMWPEKLVIGDFVVDNFFHHFCIISERVYKYLFIDNPKMSSDIIASPIRLISDKTLINEDSSYYIIIPYKIYNYEEDNNKDGIFWTCRKKGNDFYYNLNISNSFVSDFKKQKFTGITFEKYEEPVSEPKTIYFDSLEMDVKKKISYFLDEVEKTRIVKSKCKYIYYTLVEENEGYSLGVSGYMNKYFEEETLSFSPNMCDLTGTNLGKIEWEECLEKLQIIIHEIYSKKNSNFYEVKAFIGFHDSEILSIN
jgi:hypothetical protein